jgi:hypothetical protein
MKAAIRFFGVVVLAIALFVGAMVTLAAIARAHEHGAPFAEWFDELYHPTLGKCCGESDCKVTDFRIGPEGYEVLIDERFPGEGPAHWEKVPPAAILQQTKNPTGGGGGLSLSRRHDTLLRARDRGLI